jgi:hypothetical protein
MNILYCILHSKEFRGNYAKECRMLSTLSPFNTVGQPEHFRLLTLPVSQKRETERNTVDISGTGDFGKEILRSARHFKYD